MQPKLSNNNFSLCRFILRHKIFVHKNSISRFMFLLFSRGKIVSILNCDENSIKLFKKMFFFFGKFVL